MKPILDHYTTFAEMFRYPSERLETSTLALVDLLLESAPEFSRNVLQAVKQQRGMSLGEQQEYYLKTFDVQATCCLDIGYLLFGEDYKRAQMLVNLQKEHQIAGVDCRGELADHLPNLLELLAKTPDSDFGQELGFIILIPAVKFMLVKLKNVDNYYKSVLEALLACLESTFRGENLEEFMIPEQLLQENNEFLFPSPNTILCDTGCKHKSY